MNRPTAKLGEICRVVSGATPRTTEPSFWGGDIRWVTPKDLSALEGAYIHGTAQRITEAGYRSCSTELLPAGSVLLSSRAPIGYVAINSVPMCTNQGFKSFIPDPKRLDPLFLCYWLRYRRDYLQALGNGATFKELSKSAVERIEVPLPALAEQKRIAALLDIADELRRKRRQAIAKLDTLLQSVFLDMFGDPISNPKGWPAGSIDIVSSGKADVRCGPFGTQLKVEELVSSGVPIYGIENVHNGRFEPATTKFLTQEKAHYLRAFEVRPGDVLVTRMGTIGRACVVPDSIAAGRFSYHLFRIRPEPSRCLPEFLAATITRSGTFQSQLKQLAHGAIMSGLNTGDLRKVRFLLPPVALQMEYLEYTRAVERVRAVNVESLTRAETLFQSLQETLLRGRAVDGSSDVQLHLSQSGVA